MATSAGKADHDPQPFLNAVAALRASISPRGVVTQEIPAPRGIAPFSHAMSGYSENTQASEGRLILLHDPEGDPSWDGTLRLVMYLKSTVRPRDVSNPEFPKLVWEQVLSSLSQSNASHTAASGTVTSTSSQRFGEIRSQTDADRESTVEFRGSWTPIGSDIESHFQAWCHLIDTLQTDETDQVSRHSDSPR